MKINVNDLNILIIVQKNNAQRDMRVVCNCMKACASNVVSSLYGEPKTFVLE